jgi:hypothetical protein
MIAPAPRAVSEHLPIAAPHAYDLDFDRRWNAWVARGVARDAQTFRYRRIGLLAAGLVLAAIVALRLLAA